MKQKIYEEFVLESLQRIEKNIEELKTMILVSAGVPYEKIVSLQGQKEV